MHNRISLCYERWNGILMERIARFEKVSFEQFAQDWMSTFKTQNQELIRKIYEDIPLPQRATRGSAGYDFFAPTTFVLKPGQEIKFPTAIRVRMQPDWVLQLFPRSGLGFKYRLQLNNTVGIIDSDYYDSDNQGHIFVRMTYAMENGEDLEIKAKEGFMQGIFLRYGITEDDHVEEVRNGGFGSTTK